MKLFEKLHGGKITSKSEVQTVLVFDISKTFQKEMSKPKTNKNQHLEFASLLFQNCIKKYIITMSIFLLVKIVSKKARQNDVEIC